MDITEQSSSPVKPIDPAAERIFNLINLSRSDSECSESSVFDDSDADPNFQAIDSDDSNCVSKRNKIPVYTKHLVNKGSKHKSSIITSSLETPGIMEAKKCNTETFAAPLPIPSILEENKIYESVELFDNRTDKRLFRKKQSNPSLWKKNINKNLRNQGREYEDVKGKIQPARRVSNGCAEDCSFKCGLNFSETDRQKLHSTFWCLSANAKLGFFSKFTRRVPTARKRTKKQTSRRHDTFLYYFQKNIAVVRVCKLFFLTTLDVSQNRVYHFYKTKATEVGTNTPKTQGNHIKYKISEDKLNMVRDHIKNFPAIDSHYCRANTNRQYLEAGLNISKMYSLYVSETTDPVKFNIYTKVFNGEFNISFYKPKKDQCDRCVANKIAVKLTTSEIKEFEKHKENNMRAKTERDADRKNADQFTIVLSYDLQNVFSLPRANASNFFYKRKFSVYNLTAHCSINKLTYCAIWHEAISGRSGNDLASSLVKILESVVKDNPSFTKIILWSDSCVPQNRNRITTLAILKFMEKYKHIVEVQQKYSEPGHSQVQEIDAVHSTIEKFLRNIELYSPVTLIKTLKNLNYTKVKLKILQMNRNDFKNYNIASVSMTFPPFASVSNLIYEQSDLSSIKYRTRHGCEIKTTTLMKVLDTRQSVSKKKNSFKLPTVGPFVIIYKMSAEKKKDIRSMLQYMPEADREFYKIYLQ